MARTVWHRHQQQQEKEESGKWTKRSSVRHASGSHISLFPSRATNNPRPARARDFEKELFAKRLTRCPRARAPMPAPRHSGKGMRARSTHRQTHGRIIHPWLIRFEHVWQHHRSVPPRQLGTLSCSRHFITLLGPLLAPRYFFTGACRVKRAAKQNRRSRQCIPIRYRMRSADTDDLMCRGSRRELVISTAHAASRENACAATRSVCVCALLDITSDTRPRASYGATPMLEWDFEIIKRRAAVLTMLSDIRKRTRGATCPVGFRFLKCFVLRDLQTARGAEIFCSHS